MTLNAIRIEPAEENGSITVRRHRAGVALLRHECDSNKNSLACELTLVGYIRDNVERDK